MNLAAYTFSFPRKYDKNIILPHKLPVLLQYLKNAKLGYKPEAITALNNGILCELMFDIRAQQSDDSRKLLT